MTLSEALQHIVTLVEVSANLKDDTQRKVLLRSIVVATRRSRRAPDGVAECEPNVLTVLRGMPGAGARREVRRAACSPREPKHRTGIIRAIRLSEDPRSAASNLIDRPELSTR